MQFILSDSSIVEEIRLSFGEEQVKYLHFANGFTYAAFNDEKIVGFISVVTKKLPYIFDEAFESYIDIIEVKEEYRRQGVATELLRLVEEKSKKEGMYQVRAWSSKDKKEAIKMWKKLGFCLHPQEIISEVTKGKVKGYFIAKVL